MRWPILHRLPQYKETYTIMDVLEEELMGKIIEDHDFVEHLRNTPRDRILLDDTTKTCWEWAFDRNLVGEGRYLTSIDYPESHHIS